VNLEEVKTEGRWAEVDELRNTLFWRWTALAVLVVVFWGQAGRAWYLVGR